MKYLISTKTKQILKEAKSIGQKWVDTQSDLELLDLNDAVLEDGTFRKLTSIDLKPFLLETANSEYEASISALTSGVPQEEILTWTKQEAEARAWLVDNNVSTPFIDGILSERTKYSKDILVAKIIEKADAYAAAVGKLTGLRQSKEDMV